MNVKQLKDKLSKFPEDAEIVIHGKEDPKEQYVLEEAMLARIKDIDENGKVIDLPEYQGSYFPKKYKTVVSLFNYPKEFKS